MNSKNQSQTQVPWAPQSWFSSQALDEGAAAYYGHKHNGYQRFRHSCLAAMLDSVDTSLARGALLDVGCGTGALTYRIYRQYGFERAVGTDFVPAVLERGRVTYPNIDFREAVLPDLPFGDAEFDLLIASEVLYYLTPQAQRAAIGAFTRVLRPGGYLLIGSALGGSYFTPKGIRSLIDPGFDLITEKTLRMRPYHTFVSPFYYANRLDSLLASDTLPGSEAMQVGFNRLQPILVTLPVRHMVRLLAKLGRPLLSSVTLPAIFNSTSYLAAPSSISLLCRRR